ncbi:Uncharacterised protein [Metamycoplasma cloacale]|uniref:Uncharacterized protein n=1 Tax=Metamycoplasma cloacale TaxID=92401 RepID=A0A2Z4LLC9_9BACT|nr:hypothetical protein [Metamycoplasma cloacale]AWX42496.1 hypothetical protein DK849_00130 [Metamycoplasma cloacale]VEU79158.1 Uncharacterised protein [Metamycoplasma cloacale]
MKKRHKLSPSVIRTILITIITVLTFGIFIGILSIKLNNPYHVSLYNYESYLSKKIIDKVKKNYSYHVFTEINEFTKAINTEKAVAGVGSDHQIAQLILENKIKKINFERIFGTNNKEKIYEFYSPIVREHLDKFDKWIIEEVKRNNPDNIKNGMKNGIFLPYLVYNEDGIIQGAEIDGQEGVDSFYQYLVPYFIQDKVIAYNINNKYRPHLKDIENIQFENTDWTTILKTLINKHNYNRTYWTNSYLDNAMIGQFYAHESGKENYIVDNKVVDITDENYKKILNYFTEFVYETTGATIKENDRNKLVTNGLELVNEIIEPASTKADIAIMYNGDSLDSYFSEDNFSKLTDTQIKYIRPHNNYVLLDAWIISKSTNDDESNKLLDFMKENILMGSNETEENITNHFFEHLLKNINANLSIEEYLKPENFSKYYDTYKDSFDFLPVIQNFDAINYTPAYLNVNNFLNKYYFKNADGTDDLIAKDIFTISNTDQVNHQIYQPINLKLKTKIVDYYYQITKS